MRFTHQTERGSDYFREGKYDQAVAAYQEALRLKPDSALAHAKLGNVYFRLGQCAQSLAAIQEAVRLKPDFALAHAFLGGIYYGLGQYAQALTAIQEAVRLKPDFALAHAFLGGAYYRLGQYAQALAASQEAVRLKPDFALAQSIMGLAYYGLGQYTYAWEALQKVLRLNPDYGNTYYYVGKLLNKKGESGKTLDVFRKYLAWAADSRCEPERGDVREIQHLLETLEAESASTLSQEARTALPETPLQDTVSPPAVQQTEIEASEITGGQSVLRRSRPVAAFRIPHPSVTEEIPLVNVGGVYELPIEINGVLTLNFVLDTGASEVYIPADVALTLIRAGTIQDTDFLPGETYVLADGSELKGRRFVIRSLKIGSRQIKNVPATIGTLTGSLLLGQNVLERFGIWGVDSRRRVLVIGSLAATADEKYRNRIRHVQERLKVAGFNPGPINGTLGPQTKNALRQYQNAQDIPATGEPDEATRKALGVE